MKKTIYGYSGLAFLVLFFIFTILVTTVDVSVIGPGMSKVGFAKLNGAVFNRIGVHMILYKVTEIMGYLALLICVLFAIVGVIEWIKRKKIKNVDKEIILLACLYIVVAITYVLFDKLDINYRPVLIDGELERSYPSSHTLLALSVTLSAIPLVKKYLNNKIVALVINIFLIVFGVSIVVLRLVSGVHWFTDIIASILLTLGYVSTYYYLITEKK